jgi:hypothetical protein
MGGLDPTLKAARLANYLITLRKELLSLAHACGEPTPRSWASTASTSWTALGDRGRLPAGAWRGHQRLLRDDGGGVLRDGRGRVALHLRRGIALAGGERGEQERGGGGDEPGCFHE